MNEIPINARFKVAEMLISDTALTPKIANNTTCAMFIIILANKFSYERILDIYDNVKGNPLVKGRLKMRMNSLANHIKLKQAELDNILINKLPSDYLIGVTDMETKFFQKVMPAFISIEDAILNVFEEEHHLQHANFLSLVMSMDMAVTIAEQTIVNLKNVHPPVRRMLETLNMSTAYNLSVMMVREIQNLVPKNVQIDLCKELTVMSRVYKILKLIRDINLFSECFAAGGFMLEDENK